MLTIDSGQSVRHSVKSDWAFIETLNLPVLNTTGRCDRILFGRDVVDRVTAAMPDVRRLDWQNCSHLVPLKRPGRPAEALADFGAELTRRA